MSTANLDKIIEEVRALPPVERERLREMLNEEAKAAQQAERSKLVRSIMGKYAHVPTSSEDFAARKQEEIEMEDRRASGEKKG